MLTLDQERKTYETALPDMLKFGEGQFVVVRGDDICKVLPTYEEALAWGYDNFGLERFMVRQVNAVEPIAYLSRYAGSCEA